MSVVRKTHMPLSKTLRLTLAPAALCAIAHPAAGSSVADGGRFAPAAELKSRVKRSMEAILKFLSLSCGGEEDWKDLSDHEQSSLHRTR